MEYNFKIIENKWKKFWQDNKTFKTDINDFSKPKYYVLDMFPYPSGQGLHVGHVEGYTATDAVARYKRLKGFNVLHPIGFDSFGLPAEQYAVKTGNHPDGFTEKNIETFTRQLKDLGFSYDWDRVISTCKPDFYKWTQWIFLKLYNSGYARYEDTYVNWCEGLGCVLANDEIINGRSERGDFPVEKRIMKQLVIDIPKYADKLLQGLEEVDWPESTKLMQKNWIGRSEGAKIKFKVANTDKSFEVFTTRPDTLFGATYCVLSPEHSLVKEIMSTECEKSVLNYISECAKKSEMERTELNKTKTGEFVGAYAINPVNNKQIPIYIADYVLSTYGTGAVMACPAHDERDYEFAKKYNLPIIPVLNGDISTSAFTGDAEHINSEFLNGLNTVQAKEKMIDFLEQNQIGQKVVNYKMREWIFARQRYWGEPVPIIHLSNGVDLPLKEEDLPLVLPKLKNYKGVNGRPPLENATEWCNVKVDGIDGVRETSTMPGSAGSSWYYLRYIDPKNDKIFADYNLLKHWMPVDLYVGGPEHAVGHLLYSRFWNNFLYDEGLTPVKEPFKKLVHQGMILGENNEKMSKSKGNVINPDDVVKKYGADTLRLYEMFMGPITDTKPWNTQNIEGAKRFLERCFRILTSQKVKDEENHNLDKIYNQTVKKVESDYENLAFNTAISALMILMNEFSKVDIIPKKYAKGFVLMLSPIAPFISEELFELLGENAGIINATFPSYDEKLCEENEIEIPVQVNGKVRGKITIQKNEDKISVENKAKKAVENYLTAEIVKIIYVNNSIVNIVIKG